MTFNVRGCCGQHREKLLPAARDDEASTSSPCRKMTPCASICWLAEVRGSGLLLRELMRVFLSSDTACLLLTMDPTTQPQGDLQSFLPCPQHRHACQVTPGVSPSQLLAQAPSQPIPDKVHLLLCQCPIRARRTWHSSFWPLLPAPIPRPHETAVCGACLHWNELCSWRLAAASGSLYFSDASSIDL